MILTDAQKATLTAELQNDPAGVGYAQYIADKDDVMVAALYNAATVDVLGEITRANLATWAASTGMRSQIEDEAASATVLRSSALAIRDVLLGASTGIDLAKPTNGGILNLWESEGKLSAEDKASFIAYATHAIPRSIAQLGRLATQNDIAQVVRDAAGNQLIGV